MDEQHKDRDDGQVGRDEFVRDLGKAALAAGLVGLALSSVPDRVQAAAPRSTPSTNPADNPSWEGWGNVKLDVKDGWQDWDKIENPKNLRIFHDNFAQIPKLKPKHHWVMVMDLRKCIGCQACTVSCKSENNVPIGVFRTWVDTYQTGGMRPDPQGSVVTAEGNFEPEVHMVSVPKMCNHCDEPPCVEVCPVKATYKREDGPVLVDPELCIGCGTCVNACPYGARFINPVSHTADKCTLCVERVDEGLLPACVTSCVGRARVFGDLSDPNSEVSRILGSAPSSVLSPAFGTKPQVFYVGMSGEILTADDPELQRMVFTYTENSNSTVGVK